MPRIALRISVVLYLCLSLTTLNCFAVCIQSLQAGLTVSLGQRVSLTIPTSSRSFEATFIGYIPSPITSGTERTLVFMDDQNQIHLILKNAKDLRFKGVPRTRYKGLPLIPIEADIDRPACSGHATYNCLQVLGALKRLPSHTKVNSLVAEQIIAPFLQIYQEALYQRRNSIHTFMRKRRNLMSGFGLRFQHIRYEDPQRAKKLRSHLRQGKLAIIDVSIDFSMTQKWRTLYGTKATPMSVPIYEIKPIPYKFRKNFYGIPHTILALGSFVSLQGHEYVVILDSQSGDFHIFPFLEIIHSNRLLDSFLIEN